MVRIHPKSITPATHLPVIALVGDPLQWLLSPFPESAGIMSSSPAETTSFSNYACFARRMQS